MQIIPQVRDSDVEMILNNSGRPSGIAYVTFTSRSLAEQAVRDMDRKHLGSRYVELSLNY